MESPRGRIYLVRSALEGKLKWQEDVRSHLDKCLGCRACETACPSAVEYGQILELARDKIETEKPKWAKRALLNGMTKPGRFKLQLTLGGLLPGRRVPKLLSQLLSGESPEADRPTPQDEGFWPELTNLPPVKGEVYLLEGCAMRVLYPRVHQATRRLLRRVGYTVRETDQGCCGALHAHSGYLDQAHEMGTKLATQLKEDLPIIVNSAGCGSHMKEFEDETLAGRVFDASEFLFNHGLRDVLQSASWPNKTTYHDACHLAHGQKIRSQPRDLLKAIPNIQCTELNEADTCCGSAGIYNLTQPKMARQLLERKWTNIEATGATYVATGNPGCHAWIAQAAREHGQTVTVMHTLELLERALGNDE